jgi:hypothetical protein
LERAGPAGMLGPPTFDKGEHMAVHRARVEEEEALLEHFGEVFPRYARRLNLRRFRIPFFPPGYDLCADALKWLDESPICWPWRDPPELVDGLRVLWHYRTGLLLGDVRPYGRTWELGRRLFPCWVGFHPSRCRRSRQLARFFRSARLEATREFNRSLREWPREET